MAALAIALAAALGADDSAPYSVSSHINLAAEGDMSVSCTGSAPQNASSHVLAMWKGCDEHDCLAQMTSLFLHAGIYPAKAPTELSFSIDKITPPPLTADVQLYIQGVSRPEMPPAAEAGPGWGPLTLSGGCGTHCCMMPREAAGWERNPRYGALDCVTGHALPANQTIVWPLTNRTAAGERVVVNVPALMGGSWTRQGLPYARRAIKLWLGTPATGFGWGANASLHLSSLALS